MNTPSILALLTALSACASTSDPALLSTPGSASVNAAGAYEIVQGGATYTMQAGGGISAGGVSADFLSASAGGSSTAMGFSNADVTLAGGESNGSYFTGLTGTPTAGLGVAGSLSLTGLYAINNNGTIGWGGLTLTADLAAGTLIGSTPSLSVGGTINGASVSGSVVHHGTSGTFSGGFYGLVAAPTLAATVSGTNMAGIFVLN